MQESKVSKELTMRWVPVVDSLGRTRMEIRWNVAEGSVAASPITVTHAA